MEFLRIEESNPCVLLRPICFALKITLLRGDFVLLHPRFFFLSFLCDPRIVYSLVPVLAHAYCT